MKLKAYERYDPWGKTDGIGFRIVENMRSIIEKSESLLQNQYNPVFYISTVLYNLVFYISTVLLNYNKKEKKLKCTGPDNWWNSWCLDFYLFLVFLFLLNSSYFVCEEKIGIDYFVLKLGKRWDCLLRSSSAPFSLWCW